MCWNYEVSYYFSLLYLVINVYYLFKRPPYWREYFMFGMFYFIMEVYQTMQWRHGNVYMDDNYMTGVNKCDVINANYTIVAHILIWLQPILFSYIGYRTSNYDNKRFCKYLMYIGWIVLFYSLFSLHAGFMKYDYYHIDNSIFGSSTCTNQGDTGHLVWRYKPMSIDYFPNYLMYIVMCILAFLCYDKSQVQIIGLGWIVSLIFTKLILQPTSLEVASSWCLLSIIANIMIFSYISLNPIKKQHN